MACCLGTRLESPEGFWETAIVHFNFQNNETEDMLYLANPVGVVIFSHVNTFVGFMLHILCRRRSLGQQNEKYKFQKQRWFRSKRSRTVHNTHPNYSFLLVQKVIHIWSGDVCKMEMEMEMTSFVLEECLGVPN